MLPNPMTCTHQFFLILPVERPASSTASMHNLVYGAKVGCALCGEVRIVWESGELNLVAAGSKTGHDRR